MMAHKLWSGLETYFLSCLTIMLRVLNENFSRYF